MIYYFSVSLGSLCLARLSWGMMASQLWVVSIVLSSHFYLFQIMYINHSLHFFAYGKQCFVSYFSLMFTYLDSQCTEFCTLTWFSKNYTVRVSPLKIIPPNVILVDAYYYLIWGIPHNWGHQFSFVDICMIPMFHSINNTMRKVFVNKILNESSISFRSLEVWLLCWRARTLPRLFFFFID